MTMSGRRALCILIGLLTGPDDSQIETMNDKGIFLVPADHPAQFYVDAFGRSTCGS